MVTLDDPLISGVGLNFTEKKLQSAMLMIVIARQSLSSTLFWMSSLLWYSGPRVISIPFGMIL